MLTSPPENCRFGDNVTENVKNIRYNAKKQEEQIMFTNFFKRTDINQGIKEYDSTPNAVLLDVRTPQEYKEGHIPGSKNVPLQSLDKVGMFVENKDLPLFVCYSGGRSRQAASILGKTGYTNVKNLGGITGYSGELEQ